MRSWVLTALVKAPLANVLSGKSGYEVSGDINFNQENITETPIEERAQKGIFLAFQYPLRNTWCKH